MLVIEIITTSNFVTTVFEEMQYTLTLAETGWERKELKALNTSHFPNCLME